MHLLIRIHKNYNGLENKISLAKRNNNIITLLKYKQFFCDQHNVANWTNTKIKLNLAFAIRSKSKGTKLDWELIGEIGF